MSFKKILLIKPSINKGCGSIVEMGSIGMEYIAGYIHNYVNRIDIIDLAKDSKNIEYYLKKLKPDLVGICAQWTIYHNDIFKIANIAKKYGSFVTIGGYHATGLAEDFAANPYIDFVVRGEGEETMLELVKKGSAEGVKGISYRKDGKVIHNEDRPLIKDLDSIPYPARNLRKYNYKSNIFAKELDYIVTSKGCWGKCKFCCEPMMCKGMQRYRRPEMIIKEIEYILYFHKGRDLLIYIADPNFGGNPIITEEICDRLIDFRSKNNFEFSFITTSRADIMASHNILVSKMIKAGINFILLGIESPINENLESMNKFTTKDMHEKAISNIRNNNGHVIGTFCIGLQNDDMKYLQKCHEYAISLNIDYPLFCISTPFPGTELYKDFNSKGLITDNFGEKYDYNNLVFKHEYLKANELRKFVRKELAYFFNLLLIDKQYKEYYINNKKIKLFNYARKLIGLINLDRSTARKEDLLYLEEIIQEFINPYFKTLTEDNKLHNIIEMSRFLKILGNQIIQTTASVNNKPIVSHIIKTTNKSVEYIDAIKGRIQNATININFPMEEIILNKNIFNIFIIMIKNILQDNRGFRAKINLVRLFVAMMLEVLINFSQ